MEWGAEVLFFKVRFHRKQQQQKKRKQKKLFISAQQEKKKGTYFAKNAKCQWGSNNFNSQN